MASIKERVLRAIFDRPLKKGYMVGGYRISHVLGMGSYGMTYAAHHKWTGKVCAVKQLRPTKAKTTAGLRSFHREAELMQLASGVSFPRLYEVIEQDGYHFLIMEFVNGRTFEDLIFEDRRTFSEKETIAVLLELCSIVASLHEQGIYHRDLRIPNILDVNGVLRVIDFGLACYHDDPPEEPDWRYPEKQVMRAVSPTADLYHLGHFSLFLLYSQYKPAEKKERSWEEELNISEELKHILRKMLQIERPFQSIKQLQTSLQHLTYKENSADFMPYSQS
ncbi:serine/threonine protein kinase [Fictibacillus iocasae]|uniref:Serine/threonine protein kinase n=1 Tax=Fictibacillus iocasae TaxID=2715437 RepID=A0ABW2NKZ4_9BACL